MVRMDGGMDGVAQMGVKGNMEEIRVRFCIWEIVFFFFLKFLLRKEIVY